VKFIKPTVPAGEPSGGYIGAPEKRDWLKEWIENKGRWVLLECGCIDDLNDRAMTIIKTFEGCTVGCERHNRFVSVVRTLSRKTPPVKQPDEPLF
jgi:hypothetical protein